jgi:preprotein translocase subunit SecE
MLIIYVSFFNEVDAKTQKKTILETSVSFFNEVVAETKKTILETSISFFNEVAAETKKTILESLYLIMDSKRTMLQNDTMSRDKTQSWLPRGLHWKEETHSGRTPCRGS